MTEIIIDADEEDIKASIIADSFGVDTRIHVGNTHILIQSHDSDAAQRIVDDLLADLIRIKQREEARAGS